jgi:hypothetical protein
VSRVPVAVLLLVLAIPGIAAASRPATDEERMAVADGLAVPDECTTVRMSTVDGAYALLKGNGAPGCADAVDPGQHVMHLAGADWAQAAAVKNVFACPSGLPNGVGRDLGVCRTRRAYLLCANARATLRHRSFKPRRCNTLGRRQPFAAAANLAKLRWSGWGRLTATARGVERGFHKADKDIAVRVRAYRRRAGCRGDWIYTRLRVSSRYGHLVVRQPTACP